MGQLGHTDPHLTMRVYAREMVREDGDRKALRALVEGTATTIPDAVPNQPNPSDARSPRKLDAPGRVAQWESARFTRERSQVRNPPRP